MAVNIVIFASGSGSNAENLIQSFAGNPVLQVQAVFCNNPKAYVIERAKKLEVPCELFDREAFQSEAFVTLLKEKYKSDSLVLAGFLWKIPEGLIRAFPDKIINIHPALLPAYGGKGMYGMRVHEEVIRQCEKNSGITIHLVNENYDEGRVLFQASCEIATTDTPEDLAHKIHELEYRYFPQVVANYLLESKGE